MYMWVYMCVCIYVCVGSDLYSKLTQNFGLAKVAGLVRFTFLFSSMCVCLGDLGIILPKNPNHSVSVGCVSCCKQSRLTLHCLVSGHIAKHFKMFIPKVCIWGLWYVRLTPVGRLSAWCGGLCGACPRVRAGFWHLIDLHLENCCVIWADSAVSTRTEQIRLQEGKRNLLFFQQLVTHCLASWRTRRRSTHL